MQILQNKEEHKKDIKPKKKPQRNMKGNRNKHGENDLSRTLSITR